MDTAKLSRLAKGEPPRVLDLFCGCGGLSLGFQRAGCEIIGGIDNDPAALKSHAMNFHAHLGAEALRLHATPRDITNTAADSLLREFGIADPVTAVDVLVGGPPCPAFTRVGRAKLREIHEHPEAFRHDPRAQLYLPYLEYVRVLRPLALLMENVPDILNFGGHNLGEEICDALEGIGYKCAYTLLNAASYGVPQMRERFILYGVLDIVHGEIEFPTPTHNVIFPRGYLGSREVALKHVRTNDLFEKSHHYVKAPPCRGNEPGPVSAHDAIHDLPPITAHLKGRLRRGARLFDHPVGYRTDTIASPYAASMRTWPGFGSTGQIVDHVIRSLSERDFRLFRRLRPGDDYPKAKALAERLFRRELDKQLAAGGRRMSQRQLDELRRQFVPPYDPSKFPNKWRKMEPDLPARTLMAHLGKDSYSHIHYDGTQARTISVREAARLQSFPDGFRFSGTMNPAFRQIGNAVPPVFAYALAMSLLKTLKQTDCHATPHIEKTYALGPVVL